MINMVMFNTISGNNIKDLTRTLYDIEYECGVKECNNVYTGYKIKKPNPIEYATGYFEESVKPITPIVSHINTKKQKEKCIIKHFLNLIYKNEN